MTATIDFVSPGSIITPAAWRVNEVWFSIKTACFFVVAISGVFAQPTRHMMALNMTIHETRKPFVFILGQLTDYASGTPLNGGFYLAKASTFAFMAFNSSSRISTFISALNFLT